MTIMTTPPKDQNPEALRTHFEALASDPSFKLSRSRRGTYVNPAVARDWKWFQRGASHAQQPEPAAPSAAAATEVENLRKALQFYADKDHFNIADEGAWDTVSGEPQNYWCDEEGTATVEDGTIARLALAGHQIRFDADEAPQPSPTPQLPAPTEQQAYDMGAKGAPATDAERLLFEAWMRGHCWALCATWDGKCYRSDSEQNGNIDPRAMNTRQLWAAWRDRAALSAQQGGA